MSKTDAWETALLNLVFTNANTSTAAPIGDATGLRGSTTAGQLYLSLHTADPGDAGTQTTNEVAYTSYARVGRNRASGAGGFTVTAASGGSAASVSPTEAVDFPAGTGGSGTATYFGIGTAASGAGVLLYKGAITPTITLGNGVTPRLSAATAVTED